jgi:hypothetical protein
VRGHEPPRTHSRKGERFARKARSANRISFNKIIWIASEKFYPAKIFIVMIAAENTQKRERFARKARSAD